MNVNITRPTPVQLPSTSALPHALNVIAPPHSPDIPILSPPSASLTGLLSLHDELRSYCIRGVPGWLSVRPADIELTQMKKGMTNQLFIAHRRDADATTAEYSMVVVRVFGADTSTFFDREYEEYITRRLSKRGIGSRILTEFGSGRIECFLNGRTLECDDLSDPRISYLAAQALAMLHSKHIPITASLIENAKRKVQRDARKLLPPSAVQHYSDYMSPVNGSATAESGGEGSVVSPPSSPSHSMSSMSHIDGHSQPGSPPMQPRSDANAASSISPLHSVDNDAIPPKSHNSNGMTAAGEHIIDSDDMAYQEPLLYFRIHHWYNVAKRLDFTPAPDIAHLGGFSLTLSAHTKHELFQSMELSSSRVENEEQWLITRLRSLNSLIVFSHNDLQEGNLILEANTHKHDKSRRKKKSKQGTLTVAAETPETATVATTNGTHSHVQSTTTEQATSNAPSATSALTPRELLTPNRSSSLVVDVTHRPLASQQPSARQFSVAGDVTFEDLQHLMHSPMSPDSPTQSIDAITSPLRESFNALQLDQHQQQQFNTLLAPDSPSGSPALPHSHSLTFATSALCSSPFSAWRLHMIDFEYSSYNPRGFDLANHVCEHYIDYAHHQWPGFIIKDQQFPSDQHIRRFLTGYLHHYKKYTVRTHFKTIITRSQYGLYESACGLCSHAVSFCILSLRRLSCVLSRRTVDL